MGTILWLLLGIFRTLLCLNTGCTLSFLHSLTLSSVPFMHMSMTWKYHTTCGMFHIHSGHFSDLLSVLRMHIHTRFLLGWCYPNTLQWVSWRWAHAGVDMHTCSMCTAWLPESCSMSPGRSPVFSCTRRWLPIYRFGIWLTRIIPLRHCCVISWLPQCICTVVLQASTSAPSEVPTCRLSLILPLASHR